MLRSTAARLLAVLAAAALLAACAPDDGQDAGPPSPAEDAMAEDGMPEGGMAEDSMADAGMAEDDGGGLGGAGDGADITTGVEVVVDALPDEPLGWVGYRVEQGDGEARSWGPAILYVEEGSRTVEVGGAEVTLEADEAVFVEEGAEHTVPDGGVWAFLLTDPDGDPPAGLEDASRELSSGPLEGLPEGEAEIRFLIVDLPPQGGQTTVHRHPGPEYIAVVEGDIEYETGLEPTTTLSVGDDAALPPDTAVQKRNPGEEPARFWSWFIVDPDEPFASEAAFDRS